MRAGFKPSHGHCCIYPPPTSLCPVQLLDLPGIIEGAAHGKGRGRQVIAVAKSSDLVLMVLDAAKEHEKNHRAILEAELESVGLRLNQQPPNIYFRKKKVGARCATWSTSARRLIFVRICRLGASNSRALYR